MGKQRVLDTRGNQTYIDRSNLKFQAENQQGTKFLVQASDMPYPPLLKQKLSLANIKNVYTRHIKGGVTTNGNLFTSTYAALSTAPCSDFTHVRVILKNKEASPPNVSGLIIAVTNTATTFAEKVTPSTGNTITNDGSTGWVQVTFNGATTWALPAAASSTTGDAGILLTDWMPINSLTPVDGCPWPYIMARIKLDANFSYSGGLGQFSTDNTKQNYFESFRAVGTDAVTTPSNFGTPSANDANNIIFGFEFIGPGPTIPVIAIGDSITQGLHSSAGSDSVDPATLSWVPLAYSHLISDGLPFNLYNYGFSGANTTTTCAIGKTAVTTHKPAIALYSVYSPNDGSSTLTQAAADSMYARALDFGRHALINNCLPIFMFLAPNANYSSTYDPIRKSLIAKIKSKGFQVRDLTTLIGDGANPERFLSGQNFDTLHPSLTGYTNLSYGLIQELTDIYYQNFGG